MRKRPGTIIRLIDLVLLILFGYLRIADLDIKEQLPVRHVVQGESSERVQSLVYDVRVREDASIEARLLGRDAKYALVPDMVTLKARIESGALRADTEKQGFFVKVKADDLARLQRIVEVIEVCEQVSAERVRAGRQKVEYGL